MSAMGYDVWSTRLRKSERAEMAVEMEQMYICKSCAGLSANC